MSMFWNKASAVPWYHSFLCVRCCAGRISTNSPISARMNPHARCRWRISECDLYCVSTPMRRMPELTQFDSGKSMMRYLPPIGTAGLARHAVRSFSREPSPPASTRARVRRVRSVTILGSM